VWAWPAFLASGKITDEQCRNDFEPSVLAMQGHSAPLGIIFYNYSNERPKECKDIAPFPEIYDGYAFIAFHGSWNRNVPTGYKVAYVPFDPSGNAYGQPVDFLAHEPPNAQWEDGFRPVDIDFDECGRLIVTSDGTGSH
jgi:glucose/arabinose dehydrogenase